MLELCISLCMSFDQAVPSLRLARGKGESASPFQFHGRRIVTAVK